MVEQLYNFAISEEIPNIGIIAAQPNIPTRAIKAEKGYSFMDVVITWFVFMLIKLLAVL